MKNTTIAEDLVPGFYDDIPPWIHTFEFVYLLLIASFGIPGNTLIILVQSRNRVKSSTDFLVITMAIVELACSSFNITLYVCYQVSTVWSMIANDFLCCFHKFSIYLTSISSIFLLTAIAMDRYFQTCMPLSSLHNKDKAKRACIVLNCLSVLLSVPALCTYELDQQMECSRNGVNAYIMYVIDCVYAVLFIVMFGIVSTSYLKITMMLRKRHRLRVQSKVATAQISNSGSKDGKPEYKESDSKCHKPLRMANRVVPGPVLVHVKSYIENQNEPRDYSPPNSSLSDIEIIANDKDEGMRKIQNEIELKTFKSSASIHSVRQRMEPKALHNGLEKNGTDLVSELTRYVKESTFMGTNTIPNDSMPNIDQPVTVLSDNVDQMQAEFEHNAVRKEKVMKTLRIEESRLNRTTLIMSLITLVYIISWGVNWISMIFLTKETLVGRILIHMTKTSFMINCITNPVFYMLMSSRFRDNALKIVCRRT